MDMYTLYGSKCFHKRLPSGSNDFRSIWIERLSIRRCRVQVCLIVRNRNLRTISNTSWTMFSARGDIRRIRITIYIFNCRCNNLLHSNYNYPGILFLFHHFLFKTKHVLFNQRRFQQLYSSNFTKRITIHSHFHVLCSVLGERPRNRYNSYTRFQKSHGLST